jgi:hypothetical protein
LPFILMAVVFVLAYFIGMNDKRKLGS